MKNNKQTITIFFACDDAYIPFFAVSLKSLMTNASVNYNYDIKVLHNKAISKQNQNKIIDEFKNNNFNIDFVDVTNYVEEFNSKLHTRDYYSKSTYYRLFIPNMYPNLDKALYLDSDIVVNGDIAELYNTPLNDTFVGAIHDRAVGSLAVEFQEYVLNRIGVKKVENYFNAGVLLMNLKRLREINFENIFLQLLTKVTFNVAQDQDYLNVICNQNVTYIDRTWNTMPFKAKGEILPEHPKLIHYNLSFKPWHADNIMFEDIFWNWAKQTSYYDEILKIKQNYSPEMQKKSQEETVNLIKLAKSQADDTLENLKIKNIVQKVFEENIKESYGRNKKIARQG